ncbi:hypothetical protein [Anaplasma phagocytophilum]|uniref:Uncharacterized protein n=1 Tax=Anaplasma phagocytophilum str. NCH-1 TaxID=1359161 RepID=A0A0F3NED2_ANAPH|nr:hypothetical protein [Anaplasma phagocytophilum]KJV66091.1 hypothetical protein EPHNCH_0691 [Anaplasma phagocytophilum str. NCH-1]
MADQGGASGGGGKGFASRFSKGGTFTQKKGIGGNSDASSSAAGGGFTKLLSKSERPASFREDKSVLRTSKTSNNEGFAKATKKSRLDCLFLVRGKDKGRPAWHYVLVDKHKKEMFLAKSKSGSMDVALYGEILYSGWGENPPGDMVQKIKDEFGA